MLLESGNLLRVDSFKEPEDLELPATKDNAFGPERNLRIVETILTNNDCSLDFFTNYNPHSILREDATYHSYNPLRAV